MHVTGARWPHKFLKISVKNKKGKGKEKEKKKYLQKHELAVAVVCSDYLVNRNDCIKS